MADGADPTAVSHHVKALAAFTETGRALLELAERESREGRKQFMGTDRQFVLQIYGHTKSQGQEEARQSLDTSTNTLLYTDSVYFISFRLSPGIRQTENPH